MRGLTFLKMAGSEKAKILKGSWPQIFLIELARLFFVSTFLAVFVPFMPSMPESGPEPSWKFAMNQAMGQRLSVGSDVIFTFGPYASIYTMVYHPATDYLMMLGSSLIGIGYVTLVLILAKRNHSLWLICFSLFLIILYAVDDFFYARDAILFSYPVVLALVIYRISTPISNDQRIESSTTIWMAVVITFFTLGILPLIKGTLLIMVAPLCALCAFRLWKTRQKYIAIMALVMPVISVLFFWVYADQSLIHLRNYVVNLNQIISGYSDAMSFGGNWMDLFLFGLAGCSVLLAIFAEKPFSIKSHVFLLIIFGLLIFVAFKAGFVRHDIHVLIALETTLLAGLLLPLVLKNRYIIPISLLVLIAWFIVSLNYRMMNYQTLHSRIPVVYKNAWEGAWTRLTHKDRFLEDFNSSLLSIRRELQIPPLPGTTDIYSYNQAYLLASGNLWATRPVFHSYAAYNPTLLQINESYLRSARAPQNLLFRIETIDGRLPSLDDGLSWPTIINYYCFNDYIGPYMYFRRRSPISHAPLPPLQAETIYSAAHRLGDTVHIPNVNVPLFAEITLTPSAIGKAFSMVYKMPYLIMKLTLSDGVQRQYRLIPTMTMTPFLVSPLIKSTDDFRILAANESLHQLPVVKSIEIYSITPFTSLPARWPDLLWNSAYTLKLSTFHPNQEKYACRSAFDTNRDTIGR